MSGLTKIEVLNQGIAEWEVVFCIGESNESMWFYYGMSPKEVVLQLIRFTNRFVGSYLKEKYEE